MKKLSTISHDFIIMSLAKTQTYYREQSHIRKKFDTPMEKDLSLPKKNFQKSQKRDFKLF